MVVSVLSIGKTKDRVLAAITWNILLDITEKDICLRTVHIRGKDNQIADTLSHSLQVVSYLGCYNITKPCLDSSPLQCVRNKLRRAKARLGEAYSQFTYRSYQKFRTFLAFWFFASVSLSYLSVDII